MFSILAPLLFAAQVVGQQPSWRFHPNFGEPPYVMTGTPTTYGQQVPYQMPMYPQQQSTPFQYSQYQPPTKLLPGHQQYQPPTEPPPSREVIEQERDAFLRESQANVVTEIQRLEEEAENDKRTFIAEQKKAYEQYLANSERSQQQHFQQLDNQLAAHKRDAAAGAWSYADRVQKQAMELFKQIEIQDFHADYERKIDPIAKEELGYKEELEHQIRAAYDAVRHGGTVSDPTGRINEAWRRFDQQMQPLVQRRDQLQAELTRNLAIVADMN